MARQKSSSQDAADMAYESHEEQASPAQALVRRALKRPDRFARLLVIGEAIGRRSPRKLSGER